VAASPTPLGGVTAVKHYPRGTVFSFKLDRAATVKVAIRASGGYSISNEWHYLVACA